MGLKNVTLQCCYKKITKKYKVSDLRPEDNESRLICDLENNDPSVLINIFFVLFILYQLMTKPVPFFISN